jgi:hypothetical protein
MLVLLLLEVLVLLVGGICPDGAAEVACCRGQVEDIEYLAIVMFFPSAEGFQGLSPYLA